MKARIQVLSVEHKSGRSKAGTDYNMHVCQCIVYDVDPATGAEKLQIGELVLPKNHPAISPGMYDGDFGITVGQDKRIGGRRIQLTPVASPRAAVPPSAASAPERKAA